MGDQWVRRFQPAPEATDRLVCLPHAGGSASYFFPAGKVLSPEVDVLAIQYPARQDRRLEPAIETIDEFADQVVTALEPWHDLPLTLFGHSMGATIGYEVARRLERAGVRLTGLVASGRRAPSLHRAEALHLKDDAALLADIKDLSGTDTTLLDNDEMIAMILPAIRGDYRAIETYRHQPGPRLACPIVALTGDGDPRVSADEAKAWGEHTDGAFEVHTFSGGHFFVADHLVAVLDRVRDLMRSRRPA